MLLWLVCVGAFLLVSCAWSEDRKGLEGHTQLEVTAKRGPSESAATDARRADGRRHLVNWLTDGAELSEMVKVMGTPVIQDFRANRLGWISVFQYRDKELWNKHPRTKVEVWYICANFAPQSGNKLRVDVFLDLREFKEDDRFRTFGGYVGLHDNYADVESTCRRESLQSVQARLSGKD